MTLFDPDDPLAAAESRRRSLEGQARAEEHADDGWKQRAVETVERLIATRAEFTSDDVWAAGLPKPREARALGPIIAGYARRGVIVCDRYERTAQVKSHASPMAVWRVVYRPRRSNGG